MPQLHLSDQQFYYTPTSTKLKGGYTGFTLSICPSVPLWTESYPLCIFNNTHRIHFIFAHLIKQLQKVCRVWCLFKNSKIGMGNHEAAGVSSERRHSSCSSCLLRCGLCQRFDSILHLSLEALRGIPSNSGESESCRRHQSLHPGAQDRTWKARYGTKESFILSTEI